MRFIHLIAVLSLCSLSALAMGCAKADIGHPALPNSCQVYNLIEDGVGGPVFSPTDNQLQRINRLLATASWTEAPERFDTPDFSPIHLYWPEGNGRHEQVFFYPGIAVW